MLRLILGRTFSGLIALVIFLAISFVVIESLLPGDQLTLLRLTMSGGEVDELREQMGLNRPLLVRFLDWLWDFLTGGFITARFTAPGASFEFGPALASTLFVFLSGLIIAFLVGTWLGRVTAWRPGFLSGGVTFAGIAAFALFPPFLAFVLARFLRAPLFDLRRSLLDESRVLWRDTDLDETQVLVRMTIALIVAALVLAFGSRLVRRTWHRAIPFGFVLLGIAGLWLGLVALGGIAPLALDVAFSAALPILAFSLLAFGEFMLIMQTGMAEARNEDYVLSARAKGLPSHRVRDVHVARGAVLVLLASLAVSIPYLMTGLVIIERALLWEGMGSLLFRAIENQVMPAVMTALAVIGLMVLVIRLALDILHGVLDPRLRRPEKVKLAS